ncbi:MAG TPA: class I SAM-dependent methyltransferase [Anaerolineales bacterium]|nr:class I SAM-dependent methyltransferase [Anaerolineales bacterium]
MTAGSLFGQGAVIKSCCAAAYESDWAQLLLGEALHPGGLPLTERLGRQLRLGPESHVLDVACGQGAGAIHLARRFGCRVTGVDYSMRLIAQANREAARSGLSELVAFQRADAESLPFARGRFDAVVCECAFCTFPDKPAAAREFMRVLRPGGVLGMSDTTRDAQLPDGLDELAGWIACIAGAHSLDQIQTDLVQAGFSIGRVEVQNAALEQLVTEVRRKLIRAELVTKLQDIQLPGVDFKLARRVAHQTAIAVRDGSLGYALIVAAKPEHGAPRQPPLRQAGRDPLQVGEMPGSSSRPRSS